MNTYIYDSHVHSNNSFDAKDSVDSVCQFAIKNGVSGLCITDHCEINDYDEKYEANIRKSHEEVAIAQKKFGDKLNVRKGIEMAQPLQNMENAEKVLNDFPCDFIIGSMHNVKNEKDFYFMKKEDFEDRIDELLTNYYEEYYEMTKWGKFDVIGHITYPLRYIEGIYKMKVNMTKYDEIIYEMLKIAGKNGIGLEVNVSGFRQPYKKQFPNFEHIQAFKNYGGEIVTIGTDSHTANTVGTYFNEGKELLKQAGFNYYSEFKNRKPNMIKL